VAIASGPTDSPHVLQEADAPAGPGAWLAWPAAAAVREVGVHDAVIVELLIEAVPMLLKGRRGRALRGRPHDTPVNAP
jgi:hypothetical protein